jgi:hypothetical protein
MSLCDVNDKDAALRNVSVRLVAMLFSRCLSLASLIALLCLIATPALAVTYSDNGDGTVTDPTTGLTWMRCSMGQTWTGSTCFGTARTYTWSVATALATTFAGRSDWRLPNIRELQTIVDWSAIFSASFSAIDAVTFPNSPTSSFWSASADAFGTGYAWSVNFGTGEASYSLIGGAYPVRLARSGQSLGLLNMARPTSDYVDHGDGTVTHTPTGLMWKQCAEGQTWSGSSCSGTPNPYDSRSAKLLKSTFAGKNDWRLPTVDELLSLVDYTKYAPAANATIFPWLFSSTTISYLWSASIANAFDPSIVWAVSFFRGENFGYGSGVNTIQAVLVRSTTLPGNSFSLVSGWNLVGNSMSNVITVSSMLGDANKVNTVWKWVAAGNAWAFYTPALSDGGAAYAAGKGYGFLSAISGGEGFWVNAKIPFTVQLSGNPVPTSVFADSVTGNGLPQGWSLIAIGDNKTPQQFANTITANPPTTGQVASSVTTLWAWDASLTNWYFYAPSLVNAGTQAAYIASKSYLDFGAANKTLSPGTGFWVNKP